MIKKILLVVLLIITYPLTTIASSSIGAKVGNEYYDNLSDAIDASKPNETIKLLSNANLEKGIVLTKNINIDLNGNTITSPTAVFEVQRGHLTLTGKGKIKETEPNYGVIRVIGSETPTNETFSAVSVGEDITLEGWAGIFISHKNKKSHNVKVSLKGTINAVSDTSGGVGIGVYVNGSIQDKNNPPTIHILDGAKITSNGDGLYIGGYSNVIIKKANILGEENGIGIKAGNIEIDGATIICTGKDFTPTEGYNNGILKSGTTFQIESNTGYAGNIKLDIKDGKFTSKNSNVLYEHIGSGTKTQVDSIKISNGTFISEAKKNVFLLSDSFKSTHPRFIRGGKYTSNPKEYLLAGYTSNLENDYYEVSKTIMKTVFNETSNNSSNKVITVIITLVILIGLITLIFKNRNNIMITIKKWYNK